MGKFEVYSRFFKYNDFEELKKYCIFNRENRHNYKPFNCALILAQRPGASFVQSEHSWNKNGYSLKPDASPIVILQPAGPVTFVYDCEDVYSTDSQFDNMENRFFGSSIFQNDCRINGIELSGWINRVIKKEIRYAETSLGDRMNGVSESLEAPIIVKYTENSQGKTTEKSVKAYHQITLNGKLSCHDKALTLLHELGHLYCGHIKGVRTKTNNIPEYRFNSEDNQINLMNEEIDFIENELQDLRNSKASDQKILSAEKKLKLITSNKDIYIMEMKNKIEYEAELVCQILSIRNCLENNSSEEYLKGHSSSNGLIPGISMNAVLEAVETIAGILDI